MHRKSLAVAAALAMGLGLLVVPPSQAVDPILTPCEQKPLTASTSFSLMYDPNYSEKFKVEVGIATECVPTSVRATLRNTTYGFNRFSTLTLREPSSNVWISYPEVDSSDDRYPAYGAWEVDVVDIKFADGGVRQIDPTGAKLVNRHPVTLPDGYRLGPVQYGDPVSIPVNIPNAGLKSIDTTHVEVSTSTHGPWRNIFTCQDKYPPLPPPYSGVYCSFKYYPKQNEYWRYAIYQSDTVQAGASTVLGVIRVENIPEPTPPSPPIVTGVTATETTISLDWAAPTEPNGTITNYEFGWVEANDVSVTWTDPDTSITNATDPYVFGGLKPNTEYTVWVRAKNENLATWSQKAERKIKTSQVISPPPPVTKPPSAPPAFVTKTTPTTIALDWAPPADPNGTISAYRFGWSTPSGKPVPSWEDTYPVSAGVPDPLVFTKLNPDTVYSVWVEAVNEHGRSARTTLAAKTAKAAVQPPPVKRASVYTAAVSKAGKLWVDVNPNVGKGYWKFRVQKLTGTKWVNKKVYKTQTAKETRKINLKKGVYRVVVYPKYGYKGTVSKAVRLKR